MLWKKIKSLSRHAVFLLIEFMIGLPVIFFVLIIRPIRKIRFGHLYTSRIGHLGFNMDNYLCLCKKNKSKEIGIFITDPHIANSQILKMWERDNNIKFSNCSKIFSYCSEGVISLLKNFFPKSPAFIKWHTELHVFPTIFSTFPPNLRFTDDEEKTGVDLLKKIGISKQFVCFHNRDPQYLKKYGQDGNCHDFRDSKITDYVQAINFVLSSGYHAIRMGEYIRESLDLKDRNYINYAELYRDEFMDVYLMAKSFFAVSSNTGLSIIPRIFRKPQVLVNYIPFKVCELTAWAANSIVIPKKLYSHDKNRYLKFSEIELLDQNIHYKGDFYRDNNIEVVDNSPEEIYEAVKEMESRLSNSWRTNSEDEELQNRFWSSFADKESSQMVSNGLETRIGAHFLRISSNLI